MIGAVGGIFNGISNGQNIFKSALIGFSGINYSFNLPGNSKNIASSENLLYTLNQTYTTATSTASGKNILAGFLIANGITPYDAATEISLNKIISLFSSVGDWIKVGDAVTLAEFNKGYLNYTINSTTKILELSIGGKIQDQAWGVTNPVNGKIILAPRLTNGIEHNLWAASVVIHERKHFANFISGTFQGNSYISNQLDELSAYMEAASWTGTMEKEGYIHLNNVTQYFLKLSQH